MRWDTIFKIILLVWCRSVLVKSRECFAGQRGTRGQALIPDKVIANVGGPAVSALQ